MLIFGLSVAVIAMGIVFIALVSLMLIIQGSALVFQKKTDEPKVTPKAAPAPAPAPVTVTPAKADDQELIAVISAAIASCGHHNVFIKTITRLTGTTGAAWAATGRTEYMNLRQL